MLQVNKAFNWRKRIRTVYNLVVKMYIILVYDISNENNGQRRWNRVFKICKQYLNHIQNSVFEGEILESDLFKLKKKIQKEIDEKIDSVIIFKSRNERWLEKDILGTEIDDPQFI